MKTKPRGLGAKDFFALSSLFIIIIIHFSKKIF